MALRNAVIAGVLFAMTSAQALADNGLVTKPSKYSVQETVEKFEAAVNSKAAGGWVVFSRIDHAAAAPPFRFVTGNVTREITCFLFITAFVG